MSSTTTRLSLPYPVSSDATSGYPAVDESALTILDNAALITSGTAVSRPSASSVPAGSFYLATDTGVLSVSSSGSWFTIATNGGGSVIGAIQQYVGATDPVDADGVTRWNIMDGRAISRTTYAGLFAKISTTYGAGNGSTTFNIPNASGSVLLQANGSSYTLGSTGGEATHKLITTEIPSHNHGVYDPGHNHGGATVGNWTGISIQTGYATGSADFAVAYNNVGPGLTASGRGASGSTTNWFAQTTSASWGAAWDGHTHGVNDPGHAHGINSSGTGISTYDAGSDGYHNNLQPYVAVNHILRVL